MEPMFDTYIRVVNIYSDGLVADLDWLFDAQYYDNMVLYEDMGVLCVL